MEAISRFFEQGTMPWLWAEGLLASIPKEQGSVSIKVLRPFCLQILVFKLVTPTI